jgi:polysaccharide export outer membrane protein
MTIQRTTTLTRQFCKNGCLFAWLVLLTGCSTKPGTAFGLLPDGPQLIPQARELRSAQSQPAALARELDKRYADAYVVEAGDVLLVQPADLDSPVRLPSDQPVLLDGTIQLGKYGRLHVGGKTVEEIEAAVKQLVTTQTKDAGTITVRAVTRASKVFYVLGDVNSPGAFPLAGRETVLDGILAAGGLTERASHNQIILSRPTTPCSCRVVLPVCYDEIVQLGDTSTNYQLTPGDRIFVAAKGFSLCDSSKKTCGPCGGPQSPCALPLENCPGGEPCIHSTPAPQIIGSSPAVKQ